MKRFSDTAFSGEKEDLRSCPGRRNKVSSWTVYKMKITCTLESLQNVLHEKQIEDDRGVLVLKREKDRLLLLEECSSAPPCDLEDLLRARC